MSEELLAYKVLRPIAFKGDRIEKGSIVHMTPEEAENIGDEYLEPAEEAEDKDVPAEPEKPEESEDSNGDEGGEKTDPDEPEKPEGENGEGGDEGTQTGTKPEDTV